MSYFYSDLPWITLLQFLTSEEPQIKKEISNCISKTGFTLDDKMRVMARSFSRDNYKQKHYRNDCDICVHGIGTCLLTIRECAREGFQKAEKDEVIKRLRLNVYPSEDAKTNMKQYLLDEFGYIYEKEETDADNIRKG